jgi:hypothetical protein
MKTMWSVIVVHENADARESAMQFCDQLVSRFWAEMEFHVRWFDYESLRDRLKAEDAAAKTAEAHVIVFAHQTRRDFPLHVKEWNDLWLMIRGEREGKLIGLPTRESAHCQRFLRHLAHRAGMDFITGLPESIAEAIPNSPELLANRAQQMTSVLDGILHREEAPRSPLPLQ